MGMSFTDRQVDALDIFAGLVVSAKTLKADIETLRKTKAENEAILTSIGNALEIDQLHAAAKAEREKAKAEIATERERAKAKIEAAEAKLAGRVAEFEARRASEDRDYEQRVKRLKEQEQEVERTRAEIEDMRVRAQKDAREAAQARQSLEAAHREADARLRRIKEAAA